MDSLTQIILGAAVGEATLGKKIGNRAMVWGAIAGTIPDLDVLANFWMIPIDALAFHRAISHSFVFSLVLSLLLGWTVHQMYRKPYHRWIGISGWSLLVWAMCSGIILAGGITAIKTIVGLGLGILGGYTIYSRYTRADYEMPFATTKDWQWMFFMSLVTHPILDCHTTYGTQFFLPFSNYRVAFNNISVADPAYTLPFMICLLIAMVLPRASKARIRWNYAGIMISSLYMVFTFYNKYRIDTIFKDSLQQQDITYSRYMTTPSILNNILWSGVAETDSSYYYGEYSFFDQNKEFKLTKKDKNRAEFRVGLDQDPTLKTLQWFSNNYFVMEKMGGDTVLFSDLRYGTFKMSPSTTAKPVFTFNVLQQSPTTYTLLDQGPSPRDTNFGETFKLLWDRMMGNIE